MRSDSHAPRVELVSLLRGFFACPVIGALADLGAAKRMRAGSFTAADLPTIQNAAALEAAFSYLQSLGVLEPAGADGFRATLAGEYVLDRTGVFDLFRSYRDYFDGFAALLSDPSAAPAVRRLENVGGTGQLHSRKFFPGALRQLAGRPVRCVVDVGCGNGEFLAAALAEHPSAAAVAADLSAEAVRAAVGRFRGTPWEGRVQGVVADAGAVAEWARPIPSGGEGAVVAIWFVLHEIAGGDVGPVVRFFQDLHALRPRAEVIVGEIVALPPDALVDARAESVMPELLLFHALSGQGVLTWGQHRDWLDRVPYRVTAEERYDEVASADGSVPSSVVWRLTPR